MSRIDETNLQILHLLQQNARTTLADMAVAVRRSESTVRERLIAMEKSGLLQGYEARVDWAQAGLPMLGLIRAGVDMTKVEQVAARLLAIPNVTRAILVTGNKPLLATVRVRDLHHLRSLLATRMQAGDLLDVEVEVALETLVAHRGPAVGPTIGPAMAAAPSNTADATPPKPAFLG